MRNKKIVFTIIFLVLTAVLVPYLRMKLAYAVSYISKPIQSIFSNASIKSSNFFVGLKELSDLQKQNDELSKKLRQFQVDQNQIYELEIESENLKKQIGFLEEHKELELIPAKIIGREPTNYLDYILIDKGENDGILENSAIITDGALVGKVDQVMPKSSKVILLTSKNSIIQAMLQKNRTYGILKGGLSGVTLENIPQDIVENGDEAVITSGLGGDIPQGILIGKVVGERSSKAEIYKILSVEPTVDFSKLELVFVIR